MSERILILDCETRGLVPELGQTAFAVATAWMQDWKWDGRVTVYRVDNPDDMALLLERMNEADLILGHNIIFDARQLIRTLGLPVDYFGSRLRDTWIWARHCMPHQRFKGGYGLKVLTKDARGLPEYADPKKWLRKNVPKEQRHDYSLLPDEILVPYLTADIVRTAGLARVLGPLVANANPGLAKTIALDEALLPWILQMELRGVRLSAEELCTVEAAMKVQLAETKRLFPDDFDFQSRTDIIEHFGYHLRKFGFVTPKGAPRADKEALKFLQARDIPLAEEVLKAREYSKLLSTYLNNWKQYLPIGRVHGAFHIVGTDTGRFCVHPDTLVEMPRDLTKYPNGVPLRDVKVNDWVYSLDDEKRLKLRRVLWVGPTKTKPAIKVTVKSRWGVESSFTLSKDHLVRMYSGDWRPAGQLKIGNRLAGFPRRGVEDYAHFFPSSTRRRCGESGGRCKEHRWVMAQLMEREVLPARWDVHHRDGNKLNNAPENLELITHSSHMKMHRERVSKEEVEKWLRGEPTERQMHRKSWQRNAKHYGLVGTNHTVVSIEDVGEHQLWDLEVEDTHAFFGGDVVLHNSSSDPNLQNIPKLLRRVLVPDDGHAFVVCDYEQMEYRAAAMLSKDAKAIKATEGDIHTESAKLIFGVTHPDKAMRQQAKTVNFALVYGAGVEKVRRQLSQTSGRVWSQQEAREAVEKVRRQFTGIAVWSATVSRFAKNEMAFTDPLGRKQYPDKFRAFALTNHVVQGFCAGIVKHALLEAFKIGLDVRLTVHDEIVVQCPITKAPEVARQLRACMENVAGFHFPVSTSICESNWFDKVEVAA